MTSRRRYSTSAASAVDTSSDKPAIPIDSATSCSSSGHGAGHQHSTKAYEHHFEPQLTFTEPLDHAVVAISKAGVKKAIELGKQQEARDPWMASLALYDLETNNDDKCYFTLHQASMNLINAASCGRNARVRLEPFLHILEVWYV